MYKITNGLVEVLQEYHPTPRLQNTTRGYTMQFQRFQPVVNAFKYRYAFLPRTIPAWNALPQLVAEVDSLDAFKQHLSTSTVLIICILHHAFSAHLFYCTFVHCRFLHFAPFFAIADHRDQDPPMAYYPLKDVATYLSRSRSSSTSDTPYTVRSNPNPT